MKDVQRKSKRDMTDGVLALFTTYSHPFQWQHPFRRRFVPLSAIRQPFAHPPTQRTAILPNLKCMEGRNEGRKEGSVYMQMGLV
uniref:Uncharacterized protein n=1 Tax=Caenorhabditis japonica TaxID=281687 RepID=A0A8R1ECV0_CAEJA